MAQIDRKLAQIGGFRVDSSSVIRCKVYETERLNDSRYWRYIIPTMSCLNYFVIAFCSQQYGDCYACRYLLEQAFTFFGEGWIDFYNKCALHRNGNPYSDDCRSLFGVMRTLHVIDDFSDPNLPYIKPLDEAFITSIYVQVALNETQCTSVHCIG